MKKILTLLLLILTPLLITACSNEETESNTPISDELTTYEGANYLFDNTTNENGTVCYEIFVRSFYDTNGDGIGDFNGITAQLPYLYDLGIKTLWLMPIMPSPTYHGYDVIDYYDVNPDYGTMEDFDNLLEESKKYNIEIMIDIVFNHSSTEISWFKDSYNDYVNNNTSEDSKADWYCWSKEAQKGYSAYKNSGIYYEARFDRSMPDINTKNPKIREEMVNILKYWVNKGVDGFRFDAVKFFDYEHTVYNVEFMSYLHDEIVKDYPNIYFVGECWDSYDVINNYYKSTFESFFTFGSSLAYSGDATIVGQVKGFRLASAFAAEIEQREKNMKANNSNAYSSYFLSNHDMDRSSKNFTGDYAKLAASLYLLLPGTPYIYYGEEIGLMGVRKTNPDDATDARRRLPMIWSENDKIGECDFPEAHRTDIMDNKQVSLGAYDQMNTNYSLYNHYKKVIQIRNKYSFIKDSIFVNLMPQISTEFDNVLVYELVYQNQSIIVVHNFEQENADVDLSKLGSLEIDAEVSVAKINPKLVGNTLRIGKYSTVILIRK